MLSDATKIAILKAAPKLSHIELIELVAEECRLAPRAWVDLTDDEEMIIALEQNKSRHWVVCEAIRQFKEKNHA